MQKAETAQPILLFLFIGSDFIQFVAQKLKLSADRTIADAKAVGCCFTLLFAHLGSDKATFAIGCQHFIDFVDD